MKGAFWALETPMFLNVKLAWLWRETGKEDVSEEEWLMEQYGKQKTKKTAKWKKLQKHAFFTFPFQLNN